MQRGGFGFVYLGTYDVRENANAVRKVKVVARLLLYMYIVICKYIYIYIYIYAYVCDYTENESGGEAMCSDV